MGRDVRIADVVPDATRAEIVADGLLTVRVVGEFLHVSRSTVYEMMDHGLLCFVKPGRSRRIPRRAAVELAARSLRGGTKAP